MSFTPTHKFKTLLQLDVPKFGSRTEHVILQPQVNEAKWTKNNHLIADELSVTIGWKEGGFDPRVMRYARIGYWLWDSALEDFDAKKHLRFTGICKTPKRSIMDNGWNVNLLCDDFTSLFIQNKPFRTIGMPEYSDTLQTIWEKICDNTGWEDPDNGEFISSVTALRDHLVITREEFKTRTLGQLTNERFRAIGKPAPKKGASSWDVWQWCIGSLGLISYIDKDECIVTDTTEHYKAADAARAVYGGYIQSMEEEADLDLSGKGILLKSFDTLNMRVLEAFYPRPGDERLKQRRAATRPKSEGGTTVTENEQSGDYDEFNRYDIQDQAELERAAQQAYEERKRQQLKGSFKTAEPMLETNDGKGVSILELRAGDAIVVATEPGLRDELNSLGSDAERVRYLVDRCDYDEDVATVIVQNLNVEAIASPVYHVESIEVDIGESKFEMDVKYHNLIVVDS